MAIGDSITQGWSATDGSGYRSGLYQRALSEGKDFTFVGALQEGPLLVAGHPFSRYHNGYGGHTIKDNSCGWSGIYELMPDPMFFGQVAPDVILLMIGVNDNNCAFDMPTIIARLNSLLDKLVGLAPKATIVLAQNTPTSLPTVEPYWTNYVNAMPGIVTTRVGLGQKFKLVDMRVMNVANTIDGLHPNDLGYATMADVWWQALRNLV